MHKITKTFTDCCICWFSCLCCVHLVHETYRPKNMLARKNYSHHLQGMSISFLVKPCRSSKHIDNRAVHKETSALTNVTKQHTWAWRKTTSFKIFSS